ncbi:GNAT family N-acetyltransferase [Altericroceibacterium xinjiangense]|uniref:GNAT family N-acetyltransferase n=1 Tax=Altericroceibacterium xinjiangense TaxID=762261 RepID=UPI000F7DA160|nr:GNAT family N-acetyltransferase [Altericroceibacterium xinjiangense]
MFTRTTRLFLRPAFPDDWQQIHRGLGDKRVARMLANVPWPYRQDDARACASRTSRPHEPRFLITLPDETGAPVIGEITLQKQAEGIELGFWIAQDRWGQGYATEAGRAVIDLARVIGHKRIVSGHFLDNPASGRVLAKLGFCPAGEVRAHFCASRGGEMVLTKHYKLDLGCGEAGPSECRMQAA